MSFFLFWPTTYVHTTISFDLRFFRPSDLPLQMPRIVLICSPPKAIHNNRQTNNAIFCNFSPSRSAGVPVFKYKAWRRKGSPLPEVLEEYKSVGATINVMPYCSQFIPIEVRVRFFYSPLPAFLASIVRQIYGKKYWEPTLGVYAMFVFLLSIRQRWNKFFLFEMVYVLIFFPNSNTTNTIYLLTRWSTSLSTRASATTPPSCPGTEGLQQSGNFIFLNK